MDTTPNPSGTGAPIISNEQYERWLEELRPFLRQGSTLWRAMDKAGILNHKTVIYEKYRCRDWFAEKIDALRATLGEMVNEAFFIMAEKISDKVKGEVPLSHDEIEVLKTVATKHRTAQPFFVDRQEQAPAKPEEFGRIVDIPIIEYVQPTAIEGEVVEAKPDETKPTDPAPANPVGTEPQATPGVAPANG